VNVPAINVTHEHLLAVLHTESRRFPAGSTVRVLDAGCGDGQLLSYLARAFPLINRDVTLELYGFDVIGPGVQRGSFGQKAVEALTQMVPDVPWSQRLAWIAAEDDWPFEDGFFHVVLSNQVMEHVHDPQHFLRQVHRCLGWGGFSAHLFPLKHVILEGHLLLPFVHRFTDYEIMRGYIAGLSRLGLGKFRRHRAATAISLERFAERHADYMTWYTHYLTYGDALRLGKRNGFRPSFKYTRELYGRKLRSLWSSRRAFEYRRQRSSLVDWLSVMALRYVAGVTLFLEKAETYRRQTG
jgi:SAM-dependent methyltransferase